MTHLEHLLTRLYEEEGEILPVPRTLLLSLVETAEIAAKIRGGLWPIGTLERFREALKPLLEEHHDGGNQTQQRVCLLSEARDGHEGKEKA